MLITEVAPDYRLDFLYDENNQLYGFIKDNSDKYYYVRDFMQNILGIIDKDGNLVVKYDYTAYGIINSITGTLASTIGQVNPFRYKGYYYDTETKMYYCKSRYYVPEWCRWLNGDSVAYLNPKDFNGMNLFAYCNNAPIGITYNGFNVGRSANGEMGSSIGENLINIATKYDEFEKINWPKTSTVFMTNSVIFSLNKDPKLAGLLGNITYKVTQQHNSADTFYSFSNVGIDSTSTGIGVNFGNWYGYSVYLTDDIGFGSSWQLTPWLTGSSGWSVENGISIGAGFINGNTTHEITFSIGNGALAGYAACAMVATLPAPGARAVAGVIAGIIFFVDLFK